jgi:hypothetical protein
MPFEEVCSDEDLYVGMDRMRSDRCSVVGCSERTDLRSEKEQLCSGHWINWQAGIIASLKEDLRLAMQMIDEHCPYAVE